MGETGSDQGLYTDCIEPRLPPPPGKGDLSAVAPLLKMHVDDLLDHIAEGLGKHCEIHECA